MAAVSEKFFAFPLLMIAFLEIVRLRVRYRKVKVAVIYLQMFNMSFYRFCK
jgi:hypothetical protein